MVARPHIWGAFALVVCAAGSARADEPARKLPSPSELDGMYVTLGPVVAATRIEDEWFDMVGAEVSAVYLTEHCFPALVGLAGGGASYGGRDGGRLWLEIEAAVNEPLPFAIGVGLGASAEVDAVREPRLGWQGTVWVFAGIIPYLRAGSVAESGSFVEAGVMIKLPTRRWF